MLRVINKSGKAFPLYGKLIPVDGSIDLEISYNEKLRRLEQEGMIVVKDLNKNLEAVAEKRVSNRRGSKRKESE